MDFVLTFTKVNIEFDIYMEIPQGINTKGGSRTINVFNILKNLYGRRKVYRAWNQNLTKGLE